MNLDTVKSALVPRRDHAGKYLTFRLGSESYGIAVLKIREIIRWTDITSVPQAPQHVRGVINLRGKIIPVLDLSLQFGLEASSAGERACIVVVQVSSASGTQVQVGLVVDAVEEVVCIPATDIEDAPDFGCSLDTHYLLGLAKIKGTVKILLDIERIVAADTFELIAQNPLPTP